MDSNYKKNTLILSTDAFEGKLEETNNVQLEVIDTIASTANLVSDTETSKAIVSNLDQAVSVEKSRSFVWQWVKQGEPNKGRWLISSNAKHQDWWNLLTQ